MRKGTILKPINSLTTPWSLMLFFLHWLKWLSVWIFEGLFLSSISHCFYMAVKFYTPRIPIYSLFWRNPKAFFHKHDWKQSLKSHWGQGEVSISVWVQTGILFGSMQHSVAKGDVSFGTSHDWWQPERDVLLLCSLGMRGLSFMVLYYL